MVLCGSCSLLFLCQIVLCGIRSRVRNSEICRIVKNIFLIGRSIFLCSFVRILRWLHFIQHSCSWHKVSEFIVQHSACAFILGGILCRHLGSCRFFGLIRCAVFFSCFCNLSGGVLFGLFTGSSCQCIVSFCLIWQDCICSGRSFCNRRIL